MDDRRLPELFCGFPRDAEHRPVPYPVACKPQAWAAGSVFLMLQATLGLSIDAWERRVVLHSTPWPSWLQRLDVRGLRVADGRVDLRIARDGQGTSVELLHREGDVDVVLGSPADG